VNVFHESEFEMKKATKKPSTATVKATAALKSPFSVGEQYLFRLVTNFWVGRIVAIFEHEIVLAEAAWIADTGRFADAMRDGIDKVTSSEIEPVTHKVVIGRGAIVDAVEYPHPLPKTQK